MVQLKSNLSPLSRRSEVSLTVLQMLTVATLTVTITKPLINLLLIPRNLITMVGINLSNLCIISNNQLFYSSSKTIIVCRLNQEEITLCWLLHKMHLMVHCQVHQLLEGHYHLLSLAILSSSNSSCSNRIIIEVLLTFNRGRIAIKNKKLRLKVKECLKTVKVSKKCLPFRCSTTTPATTVPQITTKRSNAVQLARLFLLMISISILLVIFRILQLVGKVTTIICNISQIPLLLPHYAILLLYNQATVIKRIRLIISNRILLMECQLSKSISTATTLKLPNKLQILCV